MSKTKQHPAEQLLYGQPNCKGCKLLAAKEQGQWVEGWGVEGSKVMLVLSNPYKSELLHPAHLLPGFLRIVLLRLATIDFDACYGTYACLCITADEIGADDKPKHREPTATMLRACASRLLPEIEWHDPELVLLLGATAQKAVLPDYPLTRYHGKKISLGDRIYVPMYDPHDAADSPFVNVQLIADFKFLNAQKPIREVEGVYGIDTKILPLGTGRIACDTETIGLYGKLLGGAICEVPGQSTYLPFNNVVDTLNAAKAPHLLFHNAKYDLHVLYDNGYKGHHKEVDDTELLAYCMNYDNLKLKVLGTQELGLMWPDFDKIAEAGTLANKPLDDVAKYCNQDTDVTQQLWQYLEETASPHERHLYDTCDKPLMPLLVAMERKGIAIDLDYVRGWNARLQEELDAVEAKFYQEYDITPEVMASPMQLGAWLAERGIDLPFTAKSKQRKTGKRQLALYMHSDEAIVAILRIRQIAKLQSTYVNALLTFTTADGRLHTQYNQTRVVTSRLSSSKPNLQNLPHVFEARRPFIATPGNKLIRIDYSAIDMRILAYLSEDKELMAVFERGEDIHNFMSDKLFGDHTDLHRYNTKSASYAIIYGGGPKTMYEQQSAPMGTYDASKWGKPPPLQYFKDLIRTYFETFTGVTDYHEYIKAFATEHGYAEDYYKRRRYLPALSSPNQDLFHRAIRQVLNFPIAGTAAGIFKLAIVATAPICVPVLNVHDELVFEVPEDKVDELTPRLIAAMQGIDAPCDMVAEAQVGTNLGELM